MHGSKFLRIAQRSIKTCARRATSVKTQEIRALYKTPNEWHKVYPIAAGKNQSPVDLSVKDAAVCKRESFPDLSINYDPKSITSVVNQNFSVTFMAEGNESVISGGPLKNEHKLLQFHFHWGSEDHFGSEHTLDGKQYSAELHLVHQNKKYNTFLEALENQDGLCVFGVFLQVGDEANTAYDTVANAISNVLKGDTSHPVVDGIDMAALLPKGKDYVYYNGSLTTPPLKECVQWITFVEPVNISKEHIKTFRSLCCISNGEEHTCIVDNFRPVQPLNERLLHFCPNH